MASNLPSQGGLRRSISPGHPPRPRTSDEDTDMQRLPIARSQWERVPEAYRPKDWVSYARTEKPLPPPPSNRDHPAFRSSSETRAPSHSHSSSPRRKPRPANLNQLPRQPNQGVDPNLLYPQASPYDPLLSSRSAPDDFARAANTANSPPLVRRRSSEYSQFSPAQLPRSPTYPPGSSRRMRSASGNDAAFSDDEEFSLFIDATTGLGPFPHFRQASIAESPVYNRDTPRSQPVSRQAAASIVSPLGDTPTTMNVLRGLAQMPHHLPSPEDTEHAAAMRERARRQRRSSDEDDEESVAIDISDSGFGMFTNTATVQREDAWLDTERRMPDDELPDYATSQAEAHAAQRQAAARRAEELQRRWREGGQRYGSDY